VFNAQSVSLEDAVDINLECHLNYWPFLIAGIVFLLRLHGVGNLRYPTGLRLQPPHVVCGDIHTIHALWTGTVRNLKLCWAVLDGSPLDCVTSWRPPISRFLPTPICSRVAPANIITWPFLSTPGLGRKRRLTCSLQSYVAECRRYQPAEDLKLKFCLDLYVKIEPCCMLARSIHSSGFYQRRLGSVQ
jgi:hypothetical protein